MSASFETAYNFVPAVINSSARKPFWPGDVRGHAENEVYYAKVHCPWTEGVNFFRVFLCLFLEWPLFGKKTRGEREKKGLNRGCGEPWLGYRGGNQPGKPSGHKKLRDFLPYPIASITCSLPRGKKSRWQGISIWMWTCRSTGGLSLVLLPHGG